MCGERRFGATLVSAQFACEPKTALKKSLIYKQANKVKLTSSETGALPLVFARII